MTPESRTGICARSHGRWGAERRRDPRSVRSCTARSSAWRPLRTGRLAAARKGFGACSSSRRSHGADREVDEQHDGAADDHERDREADHRVRLLVPERAPKRLDAGL